MLSMLRKRRVFTKVVLWVLVCMISIGLLAWYGVGSIPLAPQAPQQNAPAPSPDQQAQEQQLLGLLEQYRAQKDAHPGDPTYLAAYGGVEADIGQFYAQEDYGDQATAMWQQAAQDLQQSLAGRDDQDVRLLLAQVNLNLNNVQDAESQVQFVLQKDPQQVEARALQATIYEKRQDWQHAAEIWKALADNAKDQATKDQANLRLQALQSKLK